MILKNLHEDLSRCLDKLERWFQWDLKKLQVRHHIISEKLAEAMLESQKIYITSIFMHFF